MELGILDPADARYIIGKDTQAFVMRTEDLSRDEVTFYMRWAENGPGVDSEVSITVRVEELYAREATAERVKLNLLNKLKEAVDNARSRTNEQ